MVREYVNENNRSRERLIKLVKDITDKELKLIIYKEGWTIAVALGHLAFWDERRYALAKWWQQKGVILSNIVEIDMHTINDALVPIFLAMPPRKVAELAVSAAEAVDKELANLPSALIPKIQDLDDPHALDRSLHRKMHLDEVDALLKAKGR